MPSVSTCELLLGMVLYWSRPRVVIQIQALTCPLLPCCCRLEMRGASVQEVHGGLDPQADNQQYLTDMPEANMGKQHLDAWHAGHIPLALTHACTLPLCHYLCLQPIPLVVVVEEVWRVMAVVWRRCLPCQGISRWQH